MERLQRRMGFHKADCKETKRAPLKDATRSDAKENKPYPIPNKDPHRSLKKTNVDISSFVSLRSTKSRFQRSPACLALGCGSCSKGMAATAATKASESWLKAEECLGIRVWV